LGLRDWHARRAGLKNLERNPPVTFNEKVRAKMLLDRRPLLTTFADRLAARSYVDGKLGAGFLTELHLVTDDPRRVRPDGLPSEFALKATHGCGGSVLVAECAPPERRLPDRPVSWNRFLITPESLDWTLLQRACRRWLSMRYAPETEWAYRNVPPRILVEELLTQDGWLARDYKFFVFHGRVRLVFVTTDRFRDHAVTFYSPSWERLFVRQILPLGPEVERPSRLSEMIAVAETLGEDVDFVRVDLYLVGERIVFGELTSYHASGLWPFKPSSFDVELGAWWSFPSPDSLLPAARFRRALTRL
jgi:hypothetical protein